MSEMRQLIFQASIAEKIITLRGKRVMLDRDIATLYEVKTKHLKQAVLVRNPERFPPALMFQLTEKEVDELIEKSIIPSKSHLGGALPLAFTHSGVGMLSGVLNSKKAIQVNIEIMLAFERLGEILDSERSLRELAEKVEKMDRKYGNQINIILGAIQELMNERQENDQIEKKPIGFIDQENPFFPEDKKPK